MKTAHAIQMDFRQAVRKAEELEEIAGEMKRLSKTQLRECMQSLSNAWKGDASRAYLYKGTVLQDKILATAKNLERTAVAIRRAAKRTYDAEMTAYNLARERSYHRG